jgi:hypothetical protein
MMRIGIMQKGTIETNDSKGMRRGQANSRQSVAKSAKALAREKKRAGSRAKKRALLKQGKVCFDFTTIYTVIS